MWLLLSKNNPPKLGSPASEVASLPWHNSVHQLSKESKNLPEGCEPSEVWQGQSMVCAPWKETLLPNPCSWQEERAEAQPEALMPIDGAGSCCSGSGAGEGKSNAQDPK